MFAILIAEDNMPKIVQRNVLAEKNLHGMKLFLGSSKAWYLITGYVNERGAVLPWAILPAHKFETQFEFDESKIMTDWDQIVRK